MLLLLVLLVMAEPAGDNGHLDAFLAAVTLCAVRAALPVQSPSRSPVVPSGFVRAINACTLFGDVGLQLGMLLSAVLMLLSVWPPHVLFRVGMLALRPPTCFQVPPLLPWVGVLWHLLTGMVLSVLLMSAKSR